MDRTKSFFRIRCLWLLGIPRTRGAALQHIIVKKDVMGKIGVTREKGGWQIEYLPGHAWIKLIPNFPAAFQDATGWMLQFPMAEAMGWISSSFQEGNGIWFKQA